MHFRAAANSVECRLRQIQNVFQPRCGSSHTANSAAGKLFNYGSSVAS